MRKITLFMLIIFTITSQGQNKLLSSIWQNYNGGNWFNYSGINYEYDSNNNLITETTLEWVSGVWKNKEKVTYTYDGNNKVVLELGQNWDAVSSTWKDDYKDTYTYVSGKFTGRVGQVWNGSSWINEGKLDLFYNNNLPDYALSYEWNGSWQLVDRTSVTYTGSNKVGTEITEEWDGSQWVNSEKSTYTHNGSNQLIKDTGADWNGSVWNNTETTDYVLDGTGNRSSETYIFSATNNRKEYAYDTNGLMSNFAHPFKDKTGIDYLTEDFPYVNKVLSVTHKWFNAGAYVDNYRIVYNYNSSISLSVDKQEIVKSAITVSPNPAVSVLNINVSNDVTIDKVVITDVTGRIVLQQDQNTAQINVEKLAAGLYIAQVFAGNEKFTAKFVKK